jgi:hypothetical protein
MIGWIIFAVLLNGYLTCIIWAVVLDMDVLTEVNSRLSKENQFPLIGSWHSWQLRKQYKVLVPQGKLLTYSRLLFALAFACLLGAIATFSWFHLSVTT